MKGGKPGKGKVGKDRIIGSFRLEETRRIEFNHNLTQQQQVSYTCVGDTQKRGDAMWPWTSAPLQPLEGV